MKSRCANVTVDLETPIISSVDLFRQKHPLTTLPYTEDGSNRGFQRICRYDALDRLSEISGRFVQNGSLYLSTLPFPTMSRATGYNCTGKELLVLARLTPIESLGV